MLRKRGESKEQSGKMEGATGMGHNKCSVKLQLKISTRMKTKLKIQIKTFLSSSFSPPSLPLSPTENELMQTVLTYFGLLWRNANCFCVK